MPIDRFLQPDCPQIVAHTVFESMQSRVAAGARKIPVVGWAGESPMVLLPMIREYCVDVPGLVKSIEDRAKEQKILFRQACDQASRDPRSSSGPD